MAISVVQSTSATNAFTASFSGGTAAGNTVFIAVTSLNTSSGVTITSSAPTLGGSSVAGAVKLYEIQSAYNSGAGFLVYTAAWMLPNVPGGQTAVALTVTNGQLNAFVGTLIYEVAGLGASPAMDQSSTGQSAGSTAVDSGTTGAIQSAPEFIFGSMCGGGSPGAVAGFTNQQIGSNVSEAGYQIATSSGGTYDYAATQGSGNDCYAAGIATVAAATVAGAPLPPRAAAPGRTWLRAFRRRQRPVLYAPVVPSLQSLLAQAAAQRVDIPVIGDSITEGHGASTFAGRYVNDLNNDVRAMYPGGAAGTGGGLGFVQLISTFTFSYPWPWTLVSGSLPGADVGPLRNGGVMTSACTVTWTAPAGTTSVRVMWNNPGAGVPGSWTYKVGSGGTTTVSNSGPGGDGQLTSPITITSGQVLTVAWASGTIYIDGLVHFAGDEASGLTFHGAGHSGWDASTASPNGWRQPGEDWRVSAAALQAGGFFAVCLGLNDCNTDQGDGGFTAAQYQANLSAMISYIRGNAAFAGLAVLLIFPYKPVESAGQMAFKDAGGWPAYQAAAQAVAAATWNCVLVDLTAAPAMPQPTSAGGDANFFDGIHPNDTGHADMARVIAGALAPTRTAAAAVTVTAAVTAAAVKPKTAGTTPSFTVTRTAAAHVTRHRAAARTVTATVTATATAVRHRSASRAVTATVTAAPSGHVHPAGTTPSFTVTRTAVGGAVRPRISSRTETVNRTAAAGVTRHRSVPRTITAAVTAVAAVPGGNRGAARPVTAAVTARPAHTGSRAANTVAATVAVTARAGKTSQVVVETPPDRPAGILTASDERTGGPG